MFDKSKMVDNMNLFRKESLASYMKTDGQMPKTMNARDLMAMDIGAVIGNRVFILPGTVAANDASPRVTLFFLAAAVVCGLADMCYAEFSSAIPKALSGPFNPVGGTYIKLTAILSVILITWMLSYGMLESIRVSNIAIIVKLAIIAAFIVIGVFLVKKANYHPFLPYGAHGAFKGATTVFFVF